MASVSKAEVLILVDNVKEFVKQNANLIITQKQTLLQVQNLCEGLEKLGDLIKCERENMKLEKLVISSIRELVLEAEQAIEMCVVMRKRKNTKKISMRGFNKGEEKEKIEEVDMRLQKVREKVDLLFLNFDRLEQLKFSKKKDQRWNDKDLFPGDDKHLVVGEKQLSEIIDLLKSDSVANNNLEVISITGMIGSGKTTLARRVFKHSTLESLFSLRAFVSVPQEHNKKKINVFLEILRQFGKEEEISGKEEAELVEILRDCLNNSSFLIVLDDVCSPEVLDDIRSLLAQQQQGNQEKQRKVLLVVRTRRMGIYNKNQYELSLLDLNLKESQELLRMEIFGEKDKKCSMELDVLEMKILGKCYGLPLAVISFARILARRREKVEWWKKVAEHVNVFTDTESLMSKAIRAIFDGLNDNLKLCFLYLGVFEKGFEIRVWDLLRLWLAEGLVGEGENGNNNKSIEEVAEDYLEELVNRNLVMVEKRRSNGKIKLIKIHAGLDDFCKSEAKEENIFRESFFSESCRRFSIRNSLVLQFHNSVPKSTTPTNSLRSILYFSDHPIFSSSDDNIPKPLFKVIIHNVTKPFRKTRTKPSKLPPAGELFTLFLSSVPKTFKLLRVLDVSSFMLTELPAELFSLFLLRYVAVSCDLSFLPKELSNLCNLQTLKIQTWSESETLEVRADVRDLPLLRHIHSNKSILLRKLKKGETKIGNGSAINQNLQTISRISPRSCTKELFEKIPNLEKLGVFGNLSMEGGNGIDNKHNCFEHIVELNCLRNLKLLNDDKDDAFSKYVLPPITSDSFPKNLTDLTLKNTHLAGENMSRIGKMENLEILKLQGSEFEEDSWECEDGGFGKLRVLHVKITNLNQWKATANHFPRLASLILWYCNNLEILPAGLPDMQCLETVDLSFGHDDLATSLKTILLPKLENQPGFELTIFPPYK